MAETSFFASVKGWLIRIAVKIVVAIPPLHRYVNRRLINRFAYAAGLRPRPFSMAAPYTTWRGLTDRRYSGRHLPEARAYTSRLPSLESVTAVFQRTDDRRATDTSLLFPFFAQWFTDSFLRTQWKPPAEQDFAHNESNHEIDLCQIYGVSEAQTRMLRALEGGRLKSQIRDDGEFPVALFEETAEGLALKAEFEGLYTPDNFHRVFDGATDEHKKNAFAVGLEHGNSTIGNTLMNILFLREHNRIAGVLAKAHPDWDDERLFQTARNVCIVLLLKIVIGDSIVHIAPIPFPLMAVPGMAERERWYRTNWIAVEFALLYRWHDLIPATVTFNGDTRDGSALRRNNAWLFDAGVDRICLDASAQLAGRIGLGNTADFLMPVKHHSLHMARTCALPSYNAYRRHFGKSPATSFEDLTGERDWAAKLKALYGSIDDLEWFVGIFAEGYDETDMMGDLLTTMVANDAFTQALTNPLLAEAVYNADTFSQEGLAIIDATDSLADVIVRNTGLTDRTKLGFTLKT